MWLTTFRLVFFFYVCKKCYKKFKIENHFRTTHPHTHTQFYTLSDILTRKFRPLPPCFTLSLFDPWICCALRILKVPFPSFYSVKICAAQSTPESNENDKEECKEQWLGTPKKLWKTTSNDTQPFFSASSHFVSQIHSPNTQTQPITDWHFSYCFSSPQQKKGIAGYRRKLLLSRLIRNAKLSLMLYEKWNQSKNNKNKK